MMFLTILAILVPATLALPSLTVQTSTTSRLRCSSSYGPSSLSLVGTTTVTQTTNLLPWIGTSTYTPVATVTPPPVTATVSTTVVVTSTTTVSTITDTFSTTSTIASTSTVQVTSTSTEIDAATTTTTTTATTTIPASAGFQPVSDTTASVYPQKRSLIRTERDNVANIFERSAQYGPLCKAKGKSYVQSVKCEFEILSFAATSDSDS